VKPLADQLRELGLDGNPVIAEFAQLDGERFDVVRTLDRMHRHLAFHERQLAQMYGFASKWGAPMEEVTDKDGDSRLAAMGLREAIPLLAAHYAKMTRAEKVQRWAALIHRFRRWRRENEWDEDDVYDEELVPELERTEPKLRDMLRDILTQVGRLEQTLPDKVIATFASRTGIAP